MHSRPIEHVENHKMHTQERQFTQFCILQLIYKENQTEPTVLFKTELKPKPNRTRGFSQNRTKLEKFIPHIPSFVPKHN